MNVGEDDYKYTDIQKARQKADIESHEFWTCRNNLFFNCERSHLVRRCLVFLAIIAIVPSPVGATWLPTIETIGEGILSPLSIDFKEKYEVTEMPTNAPEVVPPTKSLPPTASISPNEPLPPASTFAPTPTQPFTSTPTTTHPATIKPESIPPVASIRPVSSIPTTSAPTSNPIPTTVLPTSISPLKKPTLAPTDVSPPSSFPTTTDYEHQHHHYRTGPWLLKIIGKTIAWMIFSVLALLGMAFVLNNRYRIYYYCRYMYYRFRSLECTRRIHSTIMQYIPSFFGGGGGNPVEDPIFDTNMSTILFEDDNNIDMSEGLLMRDSIQ